MECLMKDVMQIGFYSIVSIGNIVAMYFTFKNQKSNKIRNNWEVVKQIVSNYKLIDDDLVGMRGKCKKSLSNI